MTYKELISQLMQNDDLNEEIHIENLASCYDEYFVDLNFELSTSYSNGKVTIDIDVNY